MQRYRTLIVLAVLAAAAAAAAVLVQREDAGIAKSGEKLLPGLLDRLGEVSRIEAIHKGETVTLALADGGWSVADRHGYPAATAEVRGLLVGAAELVRVEPKTAQPERYAKLELGDPADGEAESFGYAMKDAAGEAVANLVVGKRRFLATAGSDADEYFVRVPGDPRAWLVTGKIPRNRRALDWLRREVTDVDQTRVRRAAVTHPDGTVVRVAKPSPQETDFTLEGVPEGHEVEEPFSVHAIGTGITTFTLNDVARLDEVDFGGEGIEAVAETFDGVRFTARAGVLGGRTFLRMEAGFDPDLVSSETTGSLLDEEAARAEVEKLNARWRGWAYEMSEYALKNLRKRVEDMVKPVEGEGGPQGPAPGAFPAPAPVPAPAPAPAPAAPAPASE